MDQPVLVYDDDCSFCTRAARFVRRHGTVRIVGFSELDSDLEARLPETYRESAHLLSEGSVYSGGEAVERSLATTGFVPGRAIALLKRIPGYRTARERGYDVVAENRGTIGSLLP
ncbi:MAG: thiol-disulfide oxidoreductase DCC family protein [Halodesulfurarchaeum sp.]